MKNSISVVQKVKINGMDQYIFISSNDINNPLLLVLHGGPGDTCQPLMKKYNKKLEECYTVVVLEQRGYGKSYYKFEKEDNINIDMYVNDIYELSKLLLAQFKKKKLYVMGHSWGSVLGLKFIMTYPELIKKYIGCGQVVNMEKVCKESYNFALEKNTEKGNKKIIEKIKDIDCTYSDDNWFNNLLFITKQVVKHGGSIYNESSYNKFIFTFLKSYDYSFKDTIKRQKGSIQGIKYLWPELMHVNFEAIDSFDVPVIFIEGRHDYHASSKEVEKYYQTIKSEKELYWFEYSAHFPQWDEAKKFNKIMCSLVK
ncbi:alpha/beta fold hydrolase [Sporosarcina limicola]|uniref:Pimeloyl-ACP methyl ester carboxylesterase n=1 Tax=Sporosarcina limicola TaxID=34101 RepID=A0A927MNX5_9BACL|nr:alpha/beta hydrolase [Sporosarcina limicola]MBE1556332.1 pimeloyl-ACP methyl ester carboxylesterase [Sporosarcina limicola]